MEFTTKKWHVRLYLWSLDVLDAFSPPSGWKSHRSRERSNLCPYVRTILIYMPFALISQLWMWACIFVTAVSLPAYLMGGRNYATTVVGIGSLIGMVFLGRQLRRKLDKKRVAKELLMLHEERYEQAPEQPKKDPTPGFFDLIALYWEAVHNKICPEIRIIAEGNE